MTRDSDTSCCPYDISSPKGTFSAHIDNAGIRCASADAPTRAPSFRSAPWLPNPLPRLLVRHVEITQDTPGQWGGNCVATSIYSTNWPIECIAEAISRGERRK